MAVGASFDAAMPHLKETYTTYHYLTTQHTPLALASSCRPSLSSQPYLPPLSQQT